MMHQTTTETPTAISNFCPDAPEILHLSRRFGEHLEKLSKPEKCVLIVALATEVGIWSSGNPTVPTLPKILEVMLEGQAFDLTTYEVSNLRYIASSIEEIDESQQTRFITALSAQLVAGKHAPNEY